MTDRTLPNAAAVMADWQTAIDQLANDLCGVVAYREKVAACDLELDTHEAQTLLREGTDGQRLITGKNEADRKAQLILLCEGHHGYRQAVASLVTAQRELRLAEAKVETLQARIGLYKSTLAYLTATAGAS